MLPETNPLSSSDNPPETMSAEALVTMGICALETSDLDGAEAAFHRAIDHCRQSGYKVGLARALHNLAATVLTIRGKFTLALAYMEEASAIRAELGANDWGWPWLRAYYHLICGNRRLARQALDELVQEIEPATRNAGGYYFLWSRLALDENELEKAYEYLRLGMRIATQTGAPDLNVWMRVEFSHYHRKSTRYAEAREWAEDAVQLAQRSSYPYFHALALFELARVEWESGALDLAAQVLDQAEIIFKNLKSEYDLAALYYLRALWAHQTGSPNDPNTTLAWLRAVDAIEHGGYAFLLEKQQESAFPLIASHLRSENPAARAASERILDQLSRIQPPPLRIATLGQFSVWKGRSLIQERSWQKRKAGELFRFLLVQPNRSAGKEAILEALWPERDLDSGSSLLHQSTSALRRILEPDLPDKFPSRYLSYEGEQITLALPPGSSVDYENYRHKLNSAILTHDLVELEDAIALYTGELLPADRYAAWSSELRESIDALYQRGVYELAKIYFAQSQFAAALDCCRTLLRLDALNEDAALLSMHSHLKLGSITAAMRVYRAVQKSLADELDLEPRSELRDLAKSLTAR